MVAAIMKDATHQVSINAFREQDVEWVTSHIAGADTSHLEDWVITPGVFQLFSMRENPECLLFQTDLLVLLSNSCPFKILSIGLPAGAVRKPMA